MASWRGFVRRIWKAKKAFFTGVIPQIKPELAPCILNQRMSVSKNGNSATFECDYRTPLYGTIFEIIEQDCYHLDDPVFQAKTPLVVVDVGANIGVFSIWCAKKWPECRVIGVELLPGNCDWLNKNIVANDLHQIEVVNKGVGYRDAVEKFQVARDSVGGFPISAYADHRYDDNIPKGLDIIEVNVVSLKSLFEDRRITKVDILKMDCEGSEWEILRSPQNQEALLSVENISMEYHTDKGNKVKELLKILKRVGFTVTWLEPDCYGRPTLGYIMTTRRGNCN